MDDRADCVARITKLRTENNELKLRTAAFCEHFELSSMKNHSVSQHSVTNGNGDVTDDPEAHDNDGVTDDNDANGNDDVNNYLEANGNNDVTNDHEAHCYDDVTNDHEVNDSGDVTNNYEANGNNDVTKDHEAHGNNDVTNDHEVNGNNDVTNDHEANGNGDVTNYHEATSISPRSDRSVSSHVSAAAIAQVSLDIFAENNRLLHDKEMHDRQRDQDLLKLRYELEETKNQLKFEQEKYENLTDQSDRREKVTSSKMRELENELKQKVEKLEALSSERETLNHQYNDLLKQKSTWQTKIDELKSILRNQHALEKSAEQFKHENDKLKSQLKVYTDQFQDLSCQLASSKSHLQIKLEEIDHYQQLLDSKSKENFKTEYELAQIRLNELTDMNKELSDEVDVLKSKLAASAELQRAFDSQNLGLNGLKDVLKIKDAAISDMTARAKDMEQKLDETLREKEQKCSSMLKIQEELNKKSDELERLNKEFEDWKANAISQYEDTCNKYEEKIENLHAVLQKYADYPGKEDTLEKLEKCQAEIDQYQEELKKHIDLAETYKNDLAKFKSAMCQKLDSDLAQYKTESDRLKSQLDQSLNDLALCQNELAMAKTGCLNHTKDLKRCQEDNENLKTQLNQYKTKMEQRQNELELLKADCATYKAEALQYKIDKETLHQHLEHHAEELASCQQDSETCQKELDRLRAMPKGENELLERVKNELETMKLKLIEQLRDSEKHKNEASAYKSELDECRTELDALQAEYKILLAKADKSEKHVTLSESLHVQSTKTIETLTDQHADDLQRLNAYSAKINRLNAEVERLKRKILTLANEAEISAFLSQSVAARALPEIAARQRGQGDQEECSAPRLKQCMLELKQERSLLKLRCYRYKSWRNDLIFQKVYLLTIIDSYQATERAALSYMQKNGFLTTTTHGNGDGSAEKFNSVKEIYYSANDKIKPRIFTYRFKAAALVVLALIKIRRKYEKCRRYISNIDKLVSCSN